jgi:LPS-assembly protein
LENRPCYLALATFDGMRSRLKFVITASLVCHLFMGTRPVTSQALPDPAAGAAQNVPPSGKCHVVLTAPPTGARPGGAEAAPQAPSKSKVPISAEQPIEITAQQCEQADKVYSLHGDVEIKFADYVFHGDTVTYDMATGDLSATGHAVLDGGPRDMHITASHGTYNVRSQTGKLYDVSGSSGASFRGLKVTLTSSNPITFAAKMMEQTGPQEYILYHGSVTSCEMPRPKWRFHSAKIILRVGDSAKVYNSTFRLKGVPVLYLPKASLPVERLGRQSGFLIPTAGYGNSKGYMASEGFYWVINRTMDATFGGQYMSRRGWATTDGFRSRPSPKAFLNASYFQVFDRGIPPPGLSPGGTPVVQPCIHPSQNPSAPCNQGGEDAKINGETTFAHEIRGVISLEYLSSYVFRTAFAETFTQAVDSEVRSTAFVTKSVDGFSFNGFASRYQNFQSTQPGQVITILHTPAVELSSVDQRILGSPVYGSYDVAAEGLHRSEPGFVTRGLTGRFDIDPELSMPLLFHGWSLRPDVDLRNTFYTQELAPGPPPIAEQEAINRRAIDTSFEVRPPALTKTFDGTLAGRKVKHVIEPRVTYRYTNGVDNFQSIIRFDFRDILSDTNEVEYGLIQRLYLKREKDGCQREAAAGSTFTRPRGADCTPAGADDFLSWEVKQKYFLDPNFGGAILVNRRNVLTTTVDFAGIAFLTDPRRFAPIVSRLRVRTSSASSLDWELDYDTKKGRINSSTFYATMHFGAFFVEGSNAYLQVPDEQVVNQNGALLPPCIPGRLHQPPCVPLKFNQSRALLGYGSPTKRGWSAAVNVGVDSEFNLLQYGAGQTAYNWDCCGLSFEYRRFFLPSAARNENRFGFAFTLANIGSFGNLKRRERLF